MGKGGVFEGMNVGDRERKEERKKGSEETV